MAPRKKVPSLQKICKATLQSTIMDIISSLLQENPVSVDNAKLVEVLKIFLESFVYVPECHHKDFSDICLLALEELLSFVGPLSEDSLKWREEFVNLFLCTLSSFKSVSIDLDEWQGKIVSTAIVDRLIQQLSKFSKLKAFSCWEESLYRKNSLPGEILTACSEWPLLTSFTLYEVCTDQILSAISENCLLIEEIDVTDSSNVTDNSVESLNSFKKLRTMNLSDTSVSTLGLAKLFLGSKSDSFHDIRLRSVNILEFSTIQKALDIMAFALSHRSEKDVAQLYRPSQIRRFLCLLDPGGLALLSKYFPNISELSAMFDIDSPDLTVHQQFQKLEKFNLITAIFPSHQFNKCGSVITSLEMIYCDEEFLDQFMDVIPASCPNIETIQFSETGECEYATEFTPALQPRFKPFQKLKSIIWTSFFRTPYHEYILRHADNIETIETHNVDPCLDSTPNCDRVFESILLVNSLRQLKSLGSERPQDFILSMQMVKHLISSCQNIKFINCVLNPSTPDGKVAVENFIRVNNYDVVFEASRMSVNTDSDFE